MRNLFTSLCHRNVNESVLRRQLDTCAKYQQEIIVIIYSDNDQLTTSCSWQLRLGDIVTFVRTLLAAQWRWRNCGRQMEALQPREGRKSAWLVDFWNSINFWLIC